MENDNAFEGLYVDDEPYEEYMNRMLLESVQYRPNKPKEELTMDEYYDYEVEEEKPEDNTSLGLIGDVLAATFSLLFFGTVLGVCFWVIVNLIGG